MSIPRLLLLSLLICPVGATAAAQSPNNSDSSRPTLARPQTAQAGTAPFDFLVTFLADERKLSDNDGTDPRGTDSIVPRPRDSRARVLTLQQDEKTCYTIRAYRVARESPDSDSTRPAGYSTCQPTARFQLKEAVDSREIPPR
jgi:hypothetical protein